MALSLVPTVDELLVAGGVYAGFCLFEMEDGRQSTATLTVTLEYTESGPVAPLKRVVEIESGLREAFPEADVERLHLPCGPAVAKIEGNTSPLPDELAGLGVDGQLERGSYRSTSPCRTRPRSSASS